MQQTMAAPGQGEVTTRPRGLRWKLVLIAGIVGALLALRLWYDIAVTPMGDEAYYWMWGQHPAWSYLDHPPLDGWLQGLVAALFGWSNFSARALTWLSTAASLAIIWLWSARLSPADRWDWFSHTSAIYLTIPVVFLMTTAAFHDHLLMAFVVAALFCFDGFARDTEAGRLRWRMLYLAAALLGLATLTKYNGALLGIGFAVWIVLRPALRPLLRRWQLWGAALLAITMQAPVLYWNLTTGFASLRFHLTERGADWTHPNLRQLLLGYVGTIFLLGIGPFLFVRLFGLPKLIRSAAAGSTAGLSTTIFLVSTLFWAVLAPFVAVYLHWNIVAYVALVPVLYLLLGRRILFWLHVAFGSLIGALALLSYILTPLSLLGLEDPSAGAAHGWPEFGAAVEAQEAAHPGAFLAATRYTYAAQLGFVLHDADIATFNPVPSQYDLWWTAADHIGQDAVIVADHAFPIGNAAPHFASVEKLADVPVVAFGKTIWTFQIWLGKDFGHGG